MNTDSIGRRIYAEKIVEELLAHFDSEEKKENDYKKSGNKYKKEGMIFAVSGKWGSGKTQLLRLMETKLVKDGIDIVWFSPWKYSQEDITLKRAFLRKIKEDLNIDTVSLDDFYQDRSETALNEKNFLIILGLSIFVLIYFGSYIFGNTNLLSALIIPLTITLISVKKTYGKISTAEEFEEKFDALIAEKERVVIFIDDLDRCDTKTVKVILDSLRTFFQNEKCSYVVTGDHTIIEKFAAESLKANGRENVSTSEGRRYLKKLFDVYWQIPTLSPKKFLDYVRTEIEKSKIDFENNDQKENLEKFLTNDDLFDRNLRHIKRFLAQLKFALEGVKIRIEELNDAQSPEEKKELNDIRKIIKNPDLLAKILLIQEFFYSIYSDNVIHPEKIKLQEKALREVPVNELNFKPLEDILKKDDDNALSLENYKEIIRSKPQFTDEEGVVRHEASCYLLFSGSTGLPSSIGADRNLFEQYIKNGQLSEKLGDQFDSYDENSIKTYFEWASQIFDNSSNDDEKINIIKEVMRISNYVPVWYEGLDTWKQKIFTLQAERQLLVSNEFWQTVFNHRPDIIKTVFDENEVFFNTIWQGMTSASDRNELSVNTQTQIELEKIVLEKISANQDDLLAADIFLTYYDSSGIKNKIFESVINEETYVHFMAVLQEIGKPEGPISKIFNEKIQLLRQPSVKKRKSRVKKPKPPKRNS